MGQEKGSVARAEMTGREQQQAVTTFYLLLVLLCPPLSVYLDLLAVNSTVFTPSKGKR